MISAWSLFLIIPATFFAGYVLSGVMGTNKFYDKCSKCAYRKYKEDKEKPE